MITRAPILTTRYGGYFHREVPDEDAELSHVGPDTRCGEYMRRFWQPICFSDELKDLPHRVKILGEELVAFRDPTRRLRGAGLAAADRDPRLGAYRRHRSRGDDVPHPDEAWHPGR